VVSAAAVLAAAAVTELMAQAQQPAQPQQQQRPQQQQQPRPAQPPRQQQRPPAQTQPAQPAQPPQQQAQPQLELIFSPWVKLCNKDQTANAKQVCVTVKDGRLDTGQLMVSVALLEMEGEPRKLFRISMPYGVNLQHGSRLIVDQEPPASAPFVTCLPPMVPPAGCVTDYDATPELIQKLKKGRLLTLQAIHMNGEAMSPQLPLSDFAQAYDGPPVDPKLYEEQQKKMQEEFQRKQQLRQKDDTLQPQLRPDR